MAKKGMARPAWSKAPKNDAPPVPELQGKAKHGKKPANPIIAGTAGPNMKVFHKNPVSGVYSAVDGGPENQ